MIVDKFLIRLGSLNWSHYENLISSFSTQPETYFKWFTSVFYHTQTTKKNQSISNSFNTEHGYLTHMMNIYLTLHHIGLVRLPINENNDFVREIDAGFKSIREKFLFSLKPATKMINVDVMMGDGSITQVGTFEPHKVKNFYECLIKLLDGWRTTGISRYKTDDLHRMYCQFSKDTGRYRLTAYFGIQYHALPYFKVDRQVIDLQKQLNLIANEAGMTFTPIAIKGDQIIQSELEKIGCGNMNIEELLVKLMEDKELADTLDEKVGEVENEFPKLEEMSKRKDELFSELKNLMIEVYQISQDSIDYNKLMQGEEGVIADISLEKIKSQRTKETESFVNTRKISKQDARLITGTLFELENSMTQIEQSSSKSELLR